VASLLVAIASFISGALMAAPLSEAERELIVTSARKDPRGWGSQETLNVVRRLGAEGDLETLDLILSLNHTALLGIYGSGYRGARRNEAMPAIEERLVARYDDPRIAIELMRTVEKYQSKALLDRMLGDASRLAAMYADEAKRCRLVTVPSQAPAAAAQPPATHSFGVIAAPSGARKPVAGQQSPYAPPSGAHQGMIGGVISAQSVTLAPKLECDGAPPVQTPELWRMTEAIRILGNTDLPEAARRIRPHVVALSAAPALDGGAVAEAYLTSRMNDLRSIAELWGRERFVAGGPDLAAVAKKLPMRDLNNARAVWPLLKALAQMDLREGSETIVAKDPAQRIAVAR